ncbi:Pif-3 protein [Dolichomitus sp. PSUC_FEM 10030005]|nr:Pif-3 protein [Dolichomitus sp. PSUC_FEM 10030005]
MRYELPVMLLIIFTTMIVLCHGILNKGTARVRVRDPNLDNYTSGFYEFTATNSDDVDNNQLNCSKKFIPCIENGDCARLCDARYNTVAQCQNGICYIESSAESLTPDVVGSCGNNPLIIRGRKILPLGLSSDMCVSLRPDLWQSSGVPAKHVCVGGILNTILVDKKPITSCLCSANKMLVYFAAWPDIPQCIDRRAKHVYPEAVE